MSYKTFKLKGNNTLTFLCKHESFYETVAETIPWYAWKIFDQETANFRHLLC